MNESKLKKYNSIDTIVALATFPSASALGVIRISGKAAIKIASKIFKPANKKDIRKVKGNSLFYGWIVERTKAKKPKLKTGLVVDEVMLSLMRKPRSYTKEDVVEISAHGGVLVLNKILELIIEQGARQAQRGEFTYRALVNGRINLIQAEAVRDIVEARSDQGLRLAQQQLKGELSKEIDLVKQDLKELFSQVEAYINFPEDELKISTGLIKKQINQLKNKLDKLLIGSKDAKILKEGLRCIICGKTNAGKSTLFNCLLREERVIVSRIHGTTRDVIEETINIRGVPLRIYDTAGLIEPRDLVTKKAIAKTNQSFDSADLIILMLDGSRSLDKDDLFLLNKIKDKNVIIVINKRDLKQKLKAETIANFKKPKVFLSALKKKGIKDLEKAVFNSVYKNGLNRENIIFLNHYQEQFLKKAVESITEAKDCFESDDAIDLVGCSLKECLDSLAELTGEVYSEEILENIFSKFCIGK
ncbi:MAG: tRNA uridine-5-carboxymethylaminomethyl(34) synthesis GTPase MnmE [Candidatus Omnitrophica bacterium]|nr:tRNA uridine-5-carboxymethylaminomethyl(34) synthesis GTPase MnmE [Candidatus Omnitrophota bacterium]